MKEWMAMLMFLFFCVFTAVAADLVCRFEDETFLHDPSFDASLPPMQNERMPRLNYAGITFFLSTNYSYTTNATNSSVVTNQWEVNTFSYQGTNYKER